MSNKIHNYSLFIFEMEPENITTQELWNEEYKKQGIPTSYKTAPSRALKIFIDFLSERNIKISGKILELGCGKGRNSIFLAKNFDCEVFGIDISTVALNEFEENPIKQGVKKLVHIYEGSIGRILPFEDKFFHFAIDITSFFHLVEHNEIETYLSELYRVTENNAFILQFLFPKDDGFYGQLLSTSNEKGMGIYTDPENGATGRLYLEDEIKNFFSRKFKIIEFMKLEFKDLMYGKMYTRRMFLIILQK